MLSLLPLSHVAAQVTDLVIGAKMGYNIFFADPSALQGNLVRFLQVCKPYFFPFILEPYSPLFQDSGKKWNKKSLLLVLKPQELKEKLLTGPNQNLLKEHTHKSTEALFHHSGVLPKNLFSTKSSKI